MKNAYRKILWSLLAFALTGAGALLYGEEGRPKEDAGRASIDRAVEREMADQARGALLQKIYGPVQALVEKGDLPTAIFKLDELMRSYPAEAHGFILKGELLYRMGALEESLATLVQGVRLNGEYLEQKSPLSRRALIEKVAQEGLSSVGAKVRAHPENVSAARSLKDVNYLRSRLAGGCE
ncbi:hypothetical protein LPW11_20850 [Geomonas sp. RF6]|uniref:hypothetical protein n=1 Tax=Geomonas sp. RF6 TaxID=2897342 RepID=UPI001E313F68|nr:hypothetical protein [Geomonas sp. RF6]UFS70310.1 hypothetical protein LPW11_20850 [Geomonas sp. RF6]